MNILTSKEMIEMVNKGERIPPTLSLHKEQKNIPCNHQNKWRTIVCDGDNDVIECSLCGKQIVSICNFDDDFD